MKILYKLSLLFAFLLVLGAAEKDTFAQWRKVSQHLFDPEAFIPEEGNGALHVSSTTIWAGVQSLWFSEDTGKTWHKTPLQLLSGTRIHDINFIDRMHGLVATSDDGVLLTTDGGNTWKQILLGGGSDFWKASFNGSAQIIHATGSDQGVCYTSTDGGNSWSQSYLGPFVSCMAISPDHTVYVYSTKSSPYSGYGWLSTSMDFGTTWTRDTLSLADGDSYTLSVDSCNPKKLYLLSENYASSNDGFSKIFITEDAGKSWKVAVKHNIIYFTGALATTQNCLFAGGDTSGIIHGSNDTSGVGIIRSTDKGVSWERIGGPTLLADARTIEAFDDNILFALDDQGYIWYTVNAGGHYFRKNIQDTLVEFSSARIINDSFNVTIHLPIYFRANGTFGNIDMTMDYPTASLKFLDAKLYNGKSFDITGQSWNGRTALHFDQSDLRGEPDSMLGYIDFTWSPQELDCAEIDFDSIITDGCFENPVSNFHGIIGSSPACAALAVNKEISNTESAFTFSPNPAEEYGVIVSKYYSGEIFLRLYDNLGRLVLTNDWEISPGQPIKCPLTEIPNGIYTIQIHSRVGENQVKIVVSK